MTSFGNHVCSWSPAVCILFQDSDKMLVLAWRRWVCNAGDPAPRGPSWAAPPRPSASTLPGAHVHGCLGAPLRPSHKHLCNFFRNKAFKFTAPHSVPGCHFSPQEMEPPASQWHRPEGGIVLDATLTTASLPLCCHRTDASLLSRCTSFSAFPGRLWDSLPGLLVHAGLCIIFQMTNSACAYKSPSWIPAVAPCSFLL